MTPSSGARRPSTAFVWLSSLPRVAATAAVATVLGTCGGSPAAPPASSAVPVCGNGILERGEECDDGNTANGDACLSICRLPTRWVTSDPHLHTAGCDRYSSPEEVLTRLRAKRLGVGSILVWGEDFETEARSFTGHDHPLSTPDTILHYDLEISRLGPSRAGHLVLLGLDSLHFSTDVFASPNTGVPVIDWARRQSRAVVGMAHGQYWPADGTFPAPPGGCCTPFETVVHMARGKLDFLSTDRVPADRGALDAGTFKLWRSAQNAGLRVAIAGGSDWLCSHQPGDDTPLTDVIVDGPLTYENWLAAIEAGRTAVLNAFAADAHLALWVEGRRLGEEVKLASPGEVRILVEAIDDTAGDVEILVNGETAARVAVDSGAQVFETRILVTRSSWISARSRRVLTSPVYVLVGDRPVRNAPDDICYLRQSIDDLTALVTSRRLRIDGGHDEALGAYEEARAELQKRYEESGGTFCP